MSFFQALPTGLASSQVFYQSHRGRSRRENGSEGVEKTREKAQEEKGSWKHREEKD